MSIEPVSRRDFVRHAAGGALLSSFVLEHFASGVARPLIGTRPPIPAAESIKIGLIGCGGRGTGAAVQALRADPNCSLVAMGDVFSERMESSLRAIRGEMGDAASTKAPVTPDRMHSGFSSYKQVIESDADVVILTSYPNFRPAHLRAAVEAGKHVFAEKPVAVDAPGLRSVLESARLASEKNLALMIGFCWRYNDGMRAAFEQLASGAIGDIVSAHTTYHSGTLGRNPRQPSWSDLEFQMRNWWHFTWLSGDHIVEQAVHSVDRLAWAVGDRIPQRVTCLGGRAARSGPEHGNVYDHFAAVYEYAGGMRGFHTCRQIDACPSDNTDYIFGTSGSSVINGWVPTYVMRDRAGSETWRYRGDIRDMYQVEHDELFASIRAGKPINDAVRGANSTLMAIMARMAAYTGQTITWEQALNSTEDLTPPIMEFGPLPTPPVAVPGQTKFL